MTQAEWRRCAEEGAEELAVALRARALYVHRRPAARRLLGNLYEWLERLRAHEEAQAVGAEGEVEGRSASARGEVEGRSASVRGEARSVPLPPLIFYRFCRQIDALMCPGVAPIPRPRPPGGVLRPLGNVDGRIVRRIIDYWNWADGLEQRAVTFLERAGFAGSGTPLVTRELVEGNPPETDRVLTEG